jgi:plastocyanin
VLVRLVLLATLLSPVPGICGDVTGRVRWAGPPPSASSTLPTTKDRETCGPSVPDEAILVSDGGLENVVVRIEVPGAAAAPRPLGLDQRQCRYLPRVQAAAPGSTLTLRNGDPILHNVHGWLGQATAFNVPMPFQEGRTPRTLTRAGLVRVGCDVHEWMAAWILVTPTPHVAVSGPGGRFVLVGVPAGRWEAVAWHERLGERRATVEVAAGGTVELELAYP